MKQIKIADDLVLPMQAVTQKFAFLGRTGSGKTYGASKLAEEMLFNGAQIIVIDPMGVWYGLRLDADGKKPSGLDIPVFGGLHGDLPLTPESGALVADILVDRRISAILDVSQMIDAEINRFSTAFGDRFFQRMKAKPNAVHLFLEECQEFLPQNTMKGEERKLHVFQRIAKQGRNFGIGVSLLSQRPQEINKKALNMTEVMFAFQMTGPHERKAIESWIADKGEDLDIVGQLPKFKVGKPHVWSPQWLGISKQISILKKKTYDASATPEFGSHEAARELTPVDVATIKEAMQETIKQAEADDPSALKREIARLRKELNAVQSAKPAPEIREREVKIITDEQLKAIKEYLTDVKGISEELSIWEASIQALFDGKIDSLENTALQLSLAVADAKRPEIKTFSRPDKAIQIKIPPRSVKPVEPKREEFPTSETALTGPQQRILDAIAWFESIGIEAPSQVAVAFLAGYTYGGGAFNNPRGALRSMGLVEYAGDSISMTSEGRQYASIQQSPLTAEELQSRVASVLPGPHRKILSVLIDAYPNALPKRQVAELSGYAEGGAFNNPLGRLRSMGLVSYPQPAYVVAEPLLFLE